MKEQKDVVMEFLRELASQKIEGECWTPDGKLIEDPDKDELEAFEYSPDGNDEEIDKLYESIRTARELVEAHDRPPPEQMIAECVGMSKRVLATYDPHVLVPRALWKSLLEVLDNRIEVASYLAPEDYDDEEHEQECAASEAWARVVLKEAEAIEYEDEHIPLPVENDPSLASSDQGRE